MFMADDPTNETQECEDDPTFNTLGLKTKENPTHHAKLHFLSGTVSGLLTGKKNKIIQKKNVLNKRMFIK